jgi:hypothetical protein
MPFCICPKCGAKGHLRPKDYRNWKSENEKTDGRMEGTR